MISLEHSRWAICWPWQQQRPTSWDSWRDGASSMETSSPSGLATNTSSSSAPTRYNKKCTAMRKVLSLWLRRARTSHNGLQQKETGRGSLLNCLPCPPSPPLPTHPTTQSAKGMNRTELWVQWEMELFIVVWDNNRSPLSPFSNSGVNGG